VADFFLSGEPFNTAWAWKRAGEEADRWHKHLTMERALRGTGLTPDSRIDYGPHAARTRVGDYTIEALRTPMALFEEGAAMRHCVATYVRQVLGGDSHIFGVRLGGKRVATLELNRTYQPVQLQGPANSPVGKPIQAAATVFVKHVQAKVRP
jgi:hypothetical protein